MTVSTVNNKSNQIANGSNVSFVFTFHTLIETDIKVYLDDVLQSTSEYTVTLNADQEAVPGGTVVMDSAPALNVVVTLLRDMDAIQSTVYTAYDSFPAKSHEAALDKVTLITQQNINALEDVAKAPPSDDGSTDYTLPAYDAGKAILWDDPTKQLINSSSKFNNIVPDAAASAAAALVSENNAATSEANAATSALDADATLKDFETKYLGAFAVPPTEDNEGNPLIVGALYWNTVSNTTLSWNGGAWENIATIIGIADGATGPVLTLTDTDITSSVDFILPSTNALFLDGGGDTYIKEITANVMQVVVGAVEAARFQTDGVHHDDNIGSFWGNIDDLSIRHDGADATIDNTSGTLQIKENVNSGTIELSSFDGVGASKTGVIVGGAPVSVKQYFNGTLATETIANGLQINANLDINHTGVGGSRIENNLGNFVILANVNSSNLNLNAMTFAGIERLGVVIGGDSVTVKQYADGVLQSETIVGAFNVVNKLQISGQDVTVGAVDSGGAGFRVLRLPN